MNENQKQKLIEMKRDLEIIDIERTSTHGYSSDEIKIDGEIYKVTNNISNNDTANNTLKSTASARGQRIKYC